jgi:hypothetical protein
MTPGEIGRVSDGQMLAVVSVLSFCFLVWASFQALEWRHLTPRQQTVLQPIEQHWEALNMNQRVRLATAASRYTNMSESERRRFRQRLEQWMALTAAERADVREIYRTYKALPEEQRRELRNRWMLENFRSVRELQD